MYAKVPLTQSSALDGGAGAAAGKVLLASLLGKEPAGPDAEKGSEILQLLKGGRGAAKGEEGSGKGKGKGGGMGGRWWEAEGQPWKQQWEDSGAAWKKQWDAGEGSGGHWEQWSYEEAGMLLSLSLSLLLVF